MKKNLTLIGLCMVSSVASAQGYAGAVFALSKLQDACTTGFTCNDSRSNGFKLFAGHRFAKSESMSLGPVLVNRVEVSAMRFGKQSSRGTTVVSGVDGGQPVPRTVSSKDEVSADALVVAAVAEIPIVDKLNAVGKLGVAYVSAKSANVRDGVSNGSVTDNNLAPYVGLGLEFELLPTVTLQGGFDWTRYSVDGRSGSATQLGLGAAVSF